MTSPVPKKKVTGKTRSLVVFIDKIIYGIACHWLAVFNIGIGLYVLLPMIVAPTLMYVGAMGPAKVIHTIYSPLCHQMASRSFFLYGEQYAYPRELAGTALKPIEVYMPDIPEFSSASIDPAEWVTFLMPARQFLGNAEMGYKMALCERDIAIYGAIFIFGLIYALLRNRIHFKSIPIWVFFLLGMGPITLDGFSQLLSQYGTAAEALSFLNRIFLLRESPPLFRTLTGFLFGFFLAWMAYPRVADGMEETAGDLERKLVRIGELEPRTPVNS
ncbi:MAG: hypothetical protein CSA11_04415 [Chloroflexi bacterium]|nr:MAG: hypothetical protein CSA11_04415 [Chloroflexota bacterium]